MGSERFGKLLLDSQDVRRFIKVLLAAHIASRSERLIYRRARGDGVCLGERDFMPVDEVAWNVVDVVFAGHDPAIGIVFPHGLLPKDHKGWLGKPVEQVVPIQAYLLGKNNRVITFFTAFLQGVASRVPAAGDSGSL
jgi:hypothetical protein